MKKTTLMLPEKGDAFAVPMVDARWRLGYVAQWYTEHGEKLTPLIVLFERKGAQDELLADQNKALSPVGMMFTTGVKLTRSLWPLVGKIDLSYRPSEQLIADVAARKFANTLIHNEKIVEDFSNAIDGLLPWDMYKDVAYFDKLLAPGVARPTSAVFSKNF